MRKLSAIVLATSVALPSLAAAEVELSFYSGTQGAPHSRVVGTDPENTVTTDINFLAAWEGKPWAMPPYYGIRAVKWQDGGSFGWGAEFTHAKIYASEDTLAANGYDRFEFTDGHNLVTLNASYRWQDRLVGGKVTPYVGAGLGFAMPHVDITPTGGSHTFGYQVTGPVLRLYGGGKYRINDDWSVFGEYQFSYSQNEVDLDSGGHLSTDVVTNALNIGVSYSF